MHESPAVLVIVSFLATLLDCDLLRHPRYGWPTELHNDLPIQSFIGIITILDKCCSNQMSGERMVMLGLPAHRLAVCIDIVEQGLCINYARDLRSMLLHPIWSKM